MGVPDGDAVGLLLQEGSIKHVRCEDKHGQFLVSLNMQLYPWVGETYFDIGNFQ